MALYLLICSCNIGIHLYDFKENFLAIHAGMRLWMFFINIGMNKALHLYDIKEKLTRKTFLQSLHECDWTFFCNIGMSHFVLGSRFNYLFILSIWNASMLPGFQQGQFFIYTGNGSCGHYDYLFICVHIRNVQYIIDTFKCINSSSAPE